MDNVEHLLLLMHTAQRWVALLCAPIHQTTLASFWPGVLFEFVRVGSLFVCVVLCVLFSYCDWMASLLHCCIRLFMGLVVCMSCVLLGSCCLFMIYLLSCLFVYRLRFLGLANRCLVMRILCMCCCVCVFVFDWVL